MAEERMLNDEILLGLIKANSGGGGGGTTDYDDLSNKPQIGGVTLSGNKSASDLGLATTTDLSGKQDTLTFDSAPTDGSTNPVESNGVYDALATKANASDVTTALALKQDATDNNLTTTSKTVVGGINELKSGLTDLSEEVNGDATTYPYADVITIEDAVPSNLAECKVKIEPVQDLHGQSAPYVGGAGKQKLPLTVDVIKAINTSGTWSGNVYSENGATITILTDSDNNLTGIKAEAPNTPSDTVQFNLCYKGTGRNFNDIENTSVTMNGCPTGGSENTYYIQFYKYDGTLQVKDTSGGVTFTPSNIPSDARVRITIKSAIPSGGVTFYPMIRLATETDATFAPYTNICPISGHTEASVQVVDDAENPTVTKTYTIALGDTIYGGTVDFDSGVMTVDRAYFKITSTDDFAGNAPYPTAQYKVVAITDFVVDTSNRPISDRYVRGAGAGTINYGGSTTHFIRITTASEYESKADAFVELENTEICYKVEPYTIQLTPQQIQLLKGQNTLTASTGDISVTVNGVSGAIGQVQEQVNDTDEALAGLAEKLPTAPTTDGAYVLTVTVADGTPTYSWESAS